MSGAGQQQSKGDKNDWQTPPKVLDPIQEHDHITLDPCPGQRTSIGAVNLYPPRYDGLLASWDVQLDDEVVVFLNMPFSDKAEWLRKAVGEWRAGNVDRVYIVTPDSTDVQKWWHRWIAPYAKWTWFPAGRVNYIDPDSGEVVKGAAGGSAVSVLGTPPKALRDAWRESGDLVYRPDEGEV